MSPVRRLERIPSPRQNTATDPDSDRTSNAVARLYRFESDSGSCYNILASCLSEWNTNGYYDNQTGIKEFLDYSYQFGKALHTSGVSPANPTKTVQFRDIYDAHRSISRLYSHYSNGLPSDSRHHLQDANTETLHPLAAELFRCLAKWCVLWLNRYRPLFDLIPIQCEERPAIEGKKSVFLLNRAHPSCIVHSRYDQNIADTEPCTSWPFFQCSSVRPPIMDPDKDTKAHVRRIEQILEQKLEDDAWHRDMFNDNEIDSINWA